MKETNTRVSKLNNYKKGTENVMTVKNNMQEMIKKITQVLNYRSWTKIHLTHKDTIHHWNSSTNNSPQRK